MCIRLRLSQPRAPNKASKDAATTRVGITNGTPVNARRMLFPRKV